MKQLPLMILYELELNGRSSAAAVHKYLVDCAETRSYPRVTAALRDLVKRGLVTRTGVGSASIYELSFPLNDILAGLLKEFCGYICFGNDERVQLLMNDLKIDLKEDPA